MLAAEYCGSINDTERAIFLRLVPGEHFLRQSNSFPDPVIVLDTEGRVESANPAAQRLLGVQASDPPRPWPPPSPTRCDCNAPPTPTRSTRRCTTASTATNASTCPRSGRSDPPRARRSGPPSSSTT